MNTRNQTGATERVTVLDSEASVADLCAQQRAEQFWDLTASEQQGLLKALESAGESKLGIDGVFPDGASFHWDAALESTVEVTPDGRQFAFELEGPQLIRTHELPVTVGSNSSVPGDIAWRG
ncbi:MAG: hypothetical protein FJW39_31605 [Acidobacteria bacterium]|nr:hypothetical protein [Acidobacteriota bacterium]